MSYRSNDLTLSVISHGHGPLLERLLADLNALPSLDSVDVVVTLNLPGESVDIARYGRLRIQLIRNATPKGFGANHNQAFLQCRTSLFGILNPDLRLPVDPFPALLDTLSRDPGAALVAPTVMNSSGALEDSIRENLTPFSLLGRVLRRSQQIRVRDRGFHWYAGMFYLIRASDYAAIAGFDERYFLYCEDFDLCARLHLSERRLVHVRDVTVIHDAQRDSHRSMGHLRWHLASLLRVWTSLPVWRIAAQGSRRA